LLCPALAKAQTNLDQGKSPSQIFANACVECHKDPHGLARGRSASALADFLREHQYGLSEQLFAGWMRDQMVVLAANVCIAALRALAVAVATAPVVYVRPSRRDPGRGRLLDRAAIHRHWISAGLLLALPRLFEVLSAVGIGALPQSQKPQCFRYGVRDVDT